MRTAKQLYNKFTRTGELNKSGLCVVLQDTKYEKTLELFEPTKKDIVKLRRDNYYVGYWGSDLKRINSDNTTFDLFEKHIRVRHRSFTPLRQTVLLFIAAMHKEL